jgi:hypothetical protein
MRLIAPEHLNERAGVVGQAANPAIGLQLVEVAGELSGRAANRAGHFAHRGFDQGADRMCAEFAADQLDRRHRLVVACDRG